MTKAEAAIQGWVSDPTHKIHDPQFVRAPNLDYTRTNKDGTHEENVRVYTTTDGFAIHCDNYWGDSFLYYKGSLLGNYEYRYEKISALMQGIRERNAS